MRKKNYFLALDVLAAAFLAGIFFDLVADLAEAGCFFLASPFFQLNEYESNSTISLFDIRGQLLLNFTLESNEPKKTISLENYTSGVYFYKIENKEKVLETSKLIIIK
jgi:hypothetical protein